MPLVLVLLNVLSREKIRDYLRLSFWPKGFEFVPTCIFNVNQKGAPYIFYVLNAKALGKCFICLWNILLLLIYMRILSQVAMLPC